MGALFGCHLSAGTVHRMTAECGEALAEAEARIKDLVTGAPVIGADETGLRGRDTTSGCTSPGPTA